jgi:hypothetical protein
MTLLIGPTIAVPAPEPILDALSSVEVTLADRGRDAFQLTFSLGRGPSDIVDYALLLNPLLRPFNRIVIQIWMGVTPEILIDGFITRHEVQSSNDPGMSTLVVTGEDIRVMMALREVSMSYLGMSPDIRVRLILGRYALYLAAPPVVWPPIPPIAPNVLDQIPAQAGTDLSYIEDLAEQSDYVFYVDPGPAPMVNIAYWGPENRLGIPQSALSVNMGADSNVDSLGFAYDALGPTTVLGMMQDTDLGITLPVVTVAPVQPPLAPIPAMLAQQPNVRSVLPRNTGNVSYAQALAQAQAVTNASSNAVSVEGELDALRYGSLLRARRLVGVRGAGFQYDGFYYVKRVTHRIKKGIYKQSFSLRREGFGPISPVVVP